MVQALSLRDGWRMYNQNTKKNTWSQGKSQKQARLDYFLCNEELLLILNNFKINTKYRSDHTSISCNLTFQMKIEVQDFGGSTIVFYRKRNS